MIYNFNHGMGWASSGVEYAQAYRASIFRKIGKKAKFVYTDMFPSDNIEHLSANLGLLDEEVIWLYTFFTDQKIAPTTFTIEDLQKTIPQEHEIVRKGNNVRLILAGENNYYSAYMVDDTSNYVHRVEIVHNGYLIRKDYYSYCKMYSEYYAPFEQTAHLYQRCFYNENGSIAYIEMIDGDSVLYKFSDRVLYSKEQLVGYMVKLMKLSSSDTVIIDRTTNIGQAILQNVNDARVGVVIHADHFSEGSSDENNILWNNYYEYSFAQYKKIDFFISSTDAQSELVREQFKQYIGDDINVVTVPVGSVDEVKKPENPRKRHSFITASRLASEKHVDWLVGAVAIVHEKYPDVSFDIYGKGPEAEKITKAINEKNASEYIKLMGHRDLKEVYKNYELYLSASTSEGFGLTLLEAIASGLPLVGFDVRYGNPTFIAEGENGFLVELNERSSLQEKEQALADAIIKVLEADFEAFSEKSYEISERFLTKEVEKAWITLLENQ